MSSVVKLIKTKGSAIKCEAEVGKNGGHAGLIVLIEEDKERAVLGRTDPTFKTAKEAVSKMKETVATIRDGVPEPEVEEKLPNKIPSKPPCLLTEKKAEKKPRKKRKSRKKKGASDDRSDSRSNDGRTEEDGHRRKRQGRRMRDGEGRE